MGLFFIKILGEMMNNLEAIKRLSLGTADTTDVKIEYDGEEIELTMRPLTDGELTRIQAIEKKPLVVKVGMQNGQRTSVHSNDVDINTGEFTEAQNEAMYTAIALSLSVDGSTIVADDVKQLKAGLPAIIFEQVINISKLSDDDLTIIKTFRKNRRSEDTMGNP